MVLQNDRQIQISAAGSRKATYWPTINMMWSEFIMKLSTPVRGVETLSDYLNLPKSKQDDLKDVGGFVGGTLKDNRRKADKVLGRDIITLDLDNIPPGKTSDILNRIDGLGCGYVVYSTRKHEEAKPRLRLLVPLDKTVNADEYQPISRKLAELIGIELCDPTTFESSRLMYWPSCCSDSQYVFTYKDKPFISANGMLSLYKDWKNVYEWSEVPGQQQTHLRLAAKQGNPLEKNGVVGAFCKVYDIHSVIEKFLPGEYIPCDIEGRYTFTGGSTTGGAVIYDNGNFLYSHHATDPAGGKLCNSFDLVRLHKYNELDNEAKVDTPTNRLPSFQAMCELALTDNVVATIINTERYENATNDFSSEITDLNWMLKLKKNSDGVPVKTTDNVLIILENDPLLKGKIVYDEFSNTGLVLGAVPWDSRTERRSWADLDDSGIRHYLEKVYNITGKDRINDAVSMCAFKFRINDVVSYLTGLKWDGIKRIDTLLADYLGAKDSSYTRAVSRKSLVAAVKRIMEPGCKYDHVPILTGPAGIGKSTFLKKLGRQWFSESLEVFEGKEAAEMIQGTWINELGELKGFSKSEINAIKQFITKTEDIYRKPFGRNTQRYPRRCVFFGTSNENEFLNDRRFWPVDVGITMRIKSIFLDLDKEVDQIWAEAYMYWSLSENVYLSLDEEEEAKSQREIHEEINAKAGLIKEFLSKKVPLDWDKKTQVERKMFWANEFGQQSIETVDRDKITAIEILCECFGAELKHIKRQDTREINEIIKGFSDWKWCEKTIRFGCYGPQRGFIKLQP